MRHPLHPAIVHFPVACWSLAVAADFTSLWLSKAAWQWSGGLLAVGCSIALIAMPAGMTELARVPAGAAMRDTYAHMAAMLAAFTLFTTRLLVRITTNEALGRLRRKSAQNIPLEAAMTSHEPDIQAALADEPECGPEQSILRLQMCKLIEARIDQLPDAFRTVFMLRELEEMSVEEVAQALEIPEATVRTRHFRARSLLREGFAQEMEAGLGETFTFDGERCDRIVARVLARGKTTGLTAAT